jgi:long-chain fatty acid transport protein
MTAEQMSDTMMRYKDGLALAAVVAVCVGLLAPSVALGAGFSNTIQSATSNAMGGVGTANPDEPNASFYNPAIMPERKGFQVYVGPTFIMPLTSFDAPDGQTTRTEQSIFPPPNFHAAYGLENGLSFGLGLTLPYGLAIEWPDEWRGRESIQFQQLQTFDLNPSVAYEIPDTGLSIAAGGQLMYSTVELHRRIILRNDTEVQSNLGGAGTGFGATAGVFFQPNDNLSFGLNYRSAVNVDYDGQVHFENEEGTAFENQFVDGDVTTEITLPHLLAAGVGYQLNKWFFEVDAQYTTWSTYDETVIDFQRDKPQDTSTIQNDWHDALALRGGVEYQVTPNIPLRAGVALDRTPIPDETVAPSLPGNHRLVGSLGTGYRWKQFRADIGYQLVSALPRDITNDRGPRGEYKTTAHLLSVNLGYGFGKGAAKSTSGGSSGAGDASEASGAETKSTE